MSVYTYTYVYIYAYVYVHPRMYIIKCILKQYWFLHFMYMMHAETYIVYTFASTFVYLYVCVCA